MSDTDRLADYFARLENDDYRRTLPDGCANCGHSNAACRCAAYIEGEPARCCDTCSHGAT